MTFTTAHMISLLTTLAVVTFLGVSAARKVKTANDFAVGGQSTGVPIIVGTIIGTIIGGSATIGTAQLAFTVGFSAWWFTLGAGLALIVLGLFYAVPLRLSGLQTIPQFLTANYGAAAGALSGITSSLGIFFSIVANILAAVPLISAVFHLDAAAAAGVVFLLIVAYVFFGGLWGTGLVGVLKTVLIYVTLAATAVVTYTGMGGVAGFVQSFPVYPWFNLFGRGYWTDVASALALLVGTLSTQTYIQAVYAATDAVTARKGALLAAFITLPTGIPAVMAGLFMRTHHPDIAPIDAFPLFIIYYLPPWLGGIALATLLLAAIGSAAGLALGVGTMLSRDIAARWLKGRGERASLNANRLMVLAITLMAAVFTFGNLRSLVLEWNYLSMGLRGAGIFLPMTVAVFWPERIQPRWAGLSIAYGAGVALVWKLIWPQGIDPLYAGLLASAGCLVIGFVKNKRV
ncbi:MAG: sodium:solute symporter family protein [Negativicutes bacterium]|nr:sodium:solute symporter family protein [Negativicutes bacterium]